MNLLLDHNLSPRLVEALAGIYPGILHVVGAGLDRASDLAVWDYARERNLAIVSKDSDFSDLAVLKGAPPRVIWLRMGNCTSQDVRQVLIARQGDIESFLRAPGLRVLVLS